MKFILAFALVLSVLAMLVSAKSLGELNFDFFGDPHGTHSTLSFQTAVSCHQILAIVTHSCSNGTT